VLRGEGTLRTVTEHQLSSIGIPVLAIVGETDHLARPAAVERMAGVLPGLEVVVVPGAHHLSTMAHPLFLQTVRRFLDSR
jgi:3-oxoadipate enol-lactonase